MREAFLARQRRRGLIRLHWLTEMQARGVPHLHGCAFFDPAGIDCTQGQLPLAVIADWLELASGFYTSLHAQDAKPILSVLGWLEYLSKHAARGARHYQRCRETLPVQWQGRTGRMWGHVGEWPTDDPVALTLDMAGFYRLRRLHRAYKLSTARALPQGRRKARAVRAARRSLQCANPDAAPFRGISGWIPQEVTLAMVGFLAGAGSWVESV